MNLQTLQTSCPAMRQNKADTWYDQNGRIVFTNSKGLPGVGFPHNTKTEEGEPIGWIETKDLQTGTLTKCDREKDHEQVLAKLDTGSSER